MSCATNFLLLFILYQKVALYPLEENTSTIPSDIVEMGKGLSEIPAGLPTIKTINLAYNQISVLPEAIFINQSYKALTKIELYQNQISQIHLNAFRGLKQLHQVTLSDNNLTRIDPYLFKFNQKLEKLDLARNKLNFNRLQVFLVSQSLEHLIISENRIEQIYELSFMGLPNLKNLILDGNILFLIGPNSFKPLSKLQYLSLTNTGVYRLSESMFSNNLPRIVDLQGTPLANRFDPPLKKITNNAVKSLVTLDQYIFISDTPL